MQRVARVKEGCESVEGVVEASFKPMSPGIKLYLVLSMLR